MTLYHAEAAYDTNSSKDATADTVANRGILYIGPRLAPPAERPGDAAFQPAWSPPISGCRSSGDRATRRSSRPGTAPELAEAAPDLGPRPALDPAPDLAGA